MSSLTNFDGLMIVREDGYVNATALCKEFEYRLNNWKSLSETKAKIKAFNSTNVLTHNKSIEYWVVDGEKRGAITWVHTDLTPYLCECLKRHQRKTSNQEREAFFRDNLASFLNGSIEVYTPFGMIDILTNSEIIEVKRSTAWKSALGQIIAYGHFYPNHQKRIHLIGNLDVVLLQEVVSFCLTCGVIVTTEDRKLKQPKQQSESSTKVARAIQ